MPSSSQKIVARASELFGLRPADLLGDSRRAHIVRARHAAIYALCHHGLSGQAAAEALGRSDHTTTQNAIEQVKVSMAQNARYAQAVQELCAPPPLDVAAICAAARALLDAAVPFGRQAIVPTALLEALEETL